MHVKVSFSRCSLHQIIRQWNQTVKCFHLAATHYKDVKVPKNSPSVTKKQSKSPELGAVAWAVEGQHVSTPETVSKEAKKSRRKSKEKTSPSYSQSTGYPSLVDRSLILPVGLLEHLTATPKKIKKTVDSENTSILEQTKEILTIIKDAPSKVKKKKSPNSASAPIIESISEPTAIVGDIPKECKKGGGSENTLIVGNVNNHVFLENANSTAIESPTPTAKNPVEEIPFFTEKNGVILPFPFIMRDKVLKEQIDNGIMTLPRINYSVPTISQVLNDTKPESSMIALAVWRKRMIAEVGEEKFNQLQQEARTTGKNMHTCIETFLRGVDYNQVPVDPRVAGHWLSLTSILKSVQNARALESFVLHPHLKYKGVFDCVASYNGNLVLIDWKTSQRRKNTVASTYDDPVQIAAYAGAVNADENYPFTVDNALLVIAYPTGLPADAIQLNRQQLEAYWLIWLRRLQEFYRRKNAAAKQQQQND